MLKVLMLRKQITEKQAALEELRQAEAVFQTRETELMADIDAAQSDEEKEAVDAAIRQYDAEKAQTEADVRKLESEIAAAEKEIAQIEEAAPEKRAATTPKTRKDEPIMENTRFFGMSAERRDALFAREEVKDFLQRVRELRSQNRAIGGAELLIPEVFLEILRQNVAENSKLLKYVNLRSVRGKARQNIAGTIPEAVWTEMCAKLNELSLSFNNVEVDGYKVGGFMAVCNATLEDSDPSLAAEIITALGRAIGYALDKAIAYGKGVKMPLGIITRLAQTSKPSDYPDTARPWADLHTTNIVTISAANSTGVKLFQNILTSASAAKSKYSRGVKFWAMNEATLAKMQAEALGFNAAGAIVTGQSGTMPVVGGNIETLDFIPDNNILGGYGDLYLLAERAGAAIAQSEHVRFLDDQTVFKGTARYDGKPAIAEGFVLVGIGGAAPTTSLEFAPDTASTAEPETEG